MRPPCARSSSARRSLIVDGLNAIDGLSCRLPHGAFYAFPNVSSFGRTSVEIADHLLYDAGVCGLAGTAFGRHGEGYLRFSYANSRENLSARARPRRGVARPAAAHRRPGQRADGARVVSPRVFVSRVIPDEGLDPVRDACELDLWTDELPPPRDELLRRSAGMDGLLTLLTDRVDAELLDAAGPQLKVVSNYAVGFDNLDVPELTRRRIPAGNTPGVLTETTADLAFALLMAAARRIDEGSRYVRGGPLEDVGTDAPDGGRPARRNPRHRRLRPDRARDGEACLRLRHEGRVPRRPPPPLPTRSAL